MYDRSIYAVGDIHGQYWKLVNLISKLPLGESDVLIFVGDYIDRGPDSSKVIDFLIELRDSGQRCVFLRGNHEQMMLDARDAYLANDRSTAERHALWLGNGGYETMDSYPKGRPWWTRIPEAHWKFIEDTAFEYWLGPFAFVHAGFLPPDRRWNYEEDPRLWIREEFMESYHDFGARVIFGHTPQRTGKPFVMVNKLGIDTAAAYGGPLSAVRLTEMEKDSYELFQV